MILEFLRDLYHRQLYSDRGKRALHYLNRRGITDQLIKKHKLGFAFSSGYSECLKRGFKPSEIEKSRMFQQSQDGSWYDFFYNKITIPVDDKIKVYTFSSRFIDIDWEKANFKSPHVHRPGSFPIAFNHANLYYGKSIVITESPLDSMTLDKVYVPSIALLGSKKLTRKIIEDLRDKQIYICFDIDTNQAGQKAAKRLAQKLLNNDIQSYIMDLGILTGGELGYDLNDLKPTKNSMVILASLSKEYIGKKDNAKFHFDEDSVDIIEIAQQYLDLKQIGDKYQSICPFHKDHDPSLVLYPQTNSFYCFGCGVGGNANKFKKLISYS